jgi:hypothetical protein
MGKRRLLLQVFQPKSTTTTLTIAAILPIVLWGPLLVAGYSIYVTLDFRMPRSDATRHNLLLAKRTAMASPTGEIG